MSESKDNQKIKVIIVGAFVKRSNGSTGGVLFACTSLIESNISEKIEWIKIDSTAKIPIENIWMRGIKAIFRICKLLYYLITVRDVKYALIFTSEGFSFYEKGLMSLIAKLFRKKVILAPRSGLMGNSLENLWFRRFFKFVVDNVDNLVCQGSYWKNLFCDVNASDPKFLVIPNWIDCAKYSQFNLNKRIEENKFNVVFLGWTIKEKGLFELIDSIDIIKDSIPHILVFIGGDGADRTKAEKAVNEKKLSKYIQFSGWVGDQEKELLFQISDVFALPSYYEGFPNAVLEGMASGLPCIVTKVGAVEELIDKDTGILIEPRNAELIADALMYYFQYPEVRIAHGINAKNRIEKLFSIESAVDTFTRILQ